MEAILTKIEAFLAPIDVLLQSVAAHLPPMSDAEIVFWNVGPLSIVTILLILGDVLHERKAQAMQSSTNTTTSSSLKRYSSKGELVEAFARTRHDRRLASAEMIGAGGMRVSDMEIEIDMARSAVVYLPDEEAKAAGLPDGPAWCIKGFGFSPV